MTPFLACTVRDCGQPLEPIDDRYVCPRRHSYDLAREGYVNLLQPQDRRSLSPGDSKAAVEARGRLLAAGIGRAVIDQLVRCVSSLALPDTPIVADLGSGSGDALAACVSAHPGSGVGIDLSVEAARYAARRYPVLTWVVANADRRLPLISHRIDLLISIHGRRNPGECARALTGNGFLFAALPAADDLIELRTIVHGEANRVSRLDTLVAEHQAHFTPVARFTSRE